MGLRAAHGDHRLIDQAATEERHQRQPDQGESQAEDDDRQTEDADQHAIRTEPTGDDLILRQAEPIAEHDVGRRDQQHEEASEPAQREGRPHHRRAEDQGGTGEYPIADPQPDRFFRLDLARVVAHVAAEDDDEDEQGWHYRHRDGCGATIARLRELFIGEDREDAGRVERTALRHDVDEAEGVQREDQRQQACHDDHVAQPRQGDVDETLEGIRPVHRRRVVEFGVDRLQAGEQGQSEERNTLPDIDRDHRRERPTRAGDEGELRLAVAERVQQAHDAGRLQQDVQPAEGRLVEAAPGEGGDGLGDDPGEEDQPGEDGAIALHVVDEQGGGNTDPEFHEDRDDREVNSGQHGGTKGRILPELLVIAQPDPRCGTIEPDPIGEAHQDGLHDRPPDQPQEQEGERESEDVSDGPVFAQDTPRRAPEPPSTGGRHSRRAACRFNGHPRLLSFLSHYAEGRYGGSTKRDRFSRRPLLDGRRLTEKQCQRGCAAAPGPASGVLRALEAEVLPELNEAVVVVLHHILDRRALQNLGHRVGEVRATTDRVDRR